MKLFVGGEMGPWPEGKEKEIREQNLAIHHNTIKPLEDFLANKDYGDGLKDLGVIPMIFRSDIKLYKEKMSYNAKKGDADYRLKIDYASFVNANEVQKRSLLIENILGTIRLIGEEAKKKKAEFNSEKLEADIKDFLKYHG